MTIRVLDLERLAVTPKEAAALIGKSEKTIRRLLKRGDLAYSRIGSDIVIEVEEIRSLLRSTREVGRSEAQRAAHAALAVAGNVPDGLDR